MTKESNGEVATRRDSAFIRDSVARADSLARMERMRQDSIARADSLARMEQMRRDSIARDSTARADSIARAASHDGHDDTTTTSDTIRSPVTPTMSSESYGMRRGGWYLGLGGGPNVPTGTVNDFYKTGFNVRSADRLSAGEQPARASASISATRVSTAATPGTNGLTAQPDDPNIWSARRT